MKCFDGFLLSSQEPISEAECGWIDILRAVYPGGVPAPDLRSVQFFRRALIGEAVTDVDFYDRSLRGHDDPG